MNTHHGPGKPFVPGNRHGKGRPAGSRNKASLELQELLEGEGPAIMRKLIRLAKAGNERALRLCLERLIPPCRERRVQITLPLNVTNAEGVSGTLAAILTAATQGESLRAKRSNWRKWWRSVARRSRRRNLSGVSSTLKSERNKDLA